MIKLYFARIIVLHLLVEPLPLGNKYTLHIILSPAEAWEVLQVLSMAITMPVLKNIQVIIARSTLQIKLFTILIKFGNLNNQIEMHPYFLNTKTFELLMLQISSSCWLMVRWLDFLREEVNKVVSLGKEILVISYQNPVVSDCPVILHKATMYKVKFLSKGVYPK